MRNRILKNKLGVDINNYFDNIYCLNLDKRRGRWAAASYKFKKLGIRVERFSATDGSASKYVAQYKKIIKSDKSKSKKLGYKVIRSPGALGCIISYREIIKNARERGFGKILVLEDDVIFCKNFIKDFNKVSKITNNWKLLYLGASQHDWSGVKLNFTNFYNAWHSQGTFAIGIDSSIFSEILSVTKNTKIPIDSCLAANIQRKYRKKCFVFYPNIVIADVSNSDIREGSRDIKSHSKSMRWNLEKYNI